MVGSQAKLLLVWVVIPSTFSSVTWGRGGVGPPGMGLEEARGR